MYSTFNDEKTVRKQHIRRHSCTTSGNHEYSESSTRGWNMLCLSSLYPLVLWLFIFQIKFISSMCSILHSFRGGSRGCPGCPDTRPFDTVPFLKRTYFQNGRLFVGFWASGAAKFPKMGDSMPRTPVNDHAKFDAASFIPGGESVTVQSDKFTNKQTNVRSTV